jgi:hypothetical protein
MGMQYSQIFFLIIAGREVVKMKPTGGMGDLQLSSIIIIIFKYGKSEILGYIHTIWMND